MDREDLQVAGEGLQQDGEGPLFGFEELHH